MTAAHVLQHAHDVTLFEAAPRLGGHAHTVEVEKGVSVDTAFLIYNDRHYPNFVALLDQLGVRDRTEPAEMSAAFIDYDKRLHYALLRGVGGLFADRMNAIRPAFYRLFAEVALFRRRASSDLRRQVIDEGVTLGRYLAPYSPLLRDNFVVPLASAIWSLEGDHVLAYPARAILRFFHNHQLLEGHSGDAWRTFRGGSATYVRAFQAKFRGTLCLSAPISSVRRQEDSEQGGVTIHSGSEARSFDEVVFATHADAVFHRLAVIEDQIEATLRGLDHYGAGPQLGLVVDHLPGDRAAALRFGADCAGVFPRIGVRVEDARRGGGCHQGETEKCRQCGRYGDPGHVHLFKLRLLKTSAPRRHGPIVR